MATHGVNSSKALKNGVISKIHCNRAIQKHDIFYIFDVIFKTRTSDDVLYGLGLTGVRVIFDCVVIFMLSTVLTTVGQHHI